MALRNRNETLLLKCVNQISGLEHWQFCALAGKGADTKLMEAAEVLLQDTWLPERMQRERSRGQSVNLLLLSTLSASLLAPKVVSSAAWGRFGVGAPWNGVFCSSTMQEYLPRFLPMLCKPDLLLADRNSLPLSHEDISQKSHPISQCSSSTGAFCHLLCFASWAAQNVPGNRCLLPALSAASILSLPWQDDEQRGTDLLRPLLLLLRTRGVCTPDALQCGPHGPSPCVPSSLVLVSSPWRNTAILKREETPPVELVQY